MKRLILILALTATLAWGIEVGGVAGFNYQSWNDGEDNIGAGFGLHAGILGGIGITPSCLPLYVALETGFLIQGARYSWETGFGDTDLILKYNNLVIPILLKGNFELAKKVRLGAGLGPSFIIHTSGATGLGAEGWNFMGDIPSQDLKTDLGFQLKGEVGIKLIPMLWLKPSLTLQLNSNPYSPFTHKRQGSETSIFFSLGLEFKL